MSASIVNINESHRNQATELVNQFFRQVNSMSLDGVFKIRPRAAFKMTDIFLKLSGTDKVLFIGYEQETELVALLMAKVEEKPFLEEERVLFIDLAVTKNGHMKKGYMTRLLEFTENWAREQKIQAVELRAITKNEEAVKYWQRKGFDDFYIRFRKKI